MAALSKATPQWEARTKPSQMHRCRLPCIVKIKNWQKADRCKNLVKCKSSDCCWWTLSSRITWTMNILVAEGICIMQVQKSCKLPDISSIMAWCMHALFCRIVITYKFVCCCCWFFVVVSFSFYFVLLFTNLRWEIAEPASRYWHAVFHTTLKQNVSIP